MSFRRRHLLGLEGMSRDEVLDILATARSFRQVLDRPIKRVPALQGVTACNAFFEPSTRTRLSFELAEKRLSADTINFASGGSSVSKGETLRDTVRNIEAMRVDVVVIRHGASGAPHFLARNIDGHVINAGDGFHEHPTQALLDLYTIQEELGRLEGLKVTIVGDIAHSRVARSNLWGLQAVGAEVTLVGPTTLLPAEIEKAGVRVKSRLEEALDGADVVNVLRLQLERMRGGFLPSLREYAATWGITRERLALCSPNVRVMHPGPINRGVEISDEVADSRESLVLDQVTNGVAVRMAVLYLVRGGRGNGAERIPAQEGSGA
ncbi:MAG: aspartate carbamoyltransferase catalytic subunit [Candidatus Eisenbacteria bacterium]|nr:aspartate carbamoyltransferase catalytic subunit [Candidatus Latescibacterota bacterium]MBD3302502.1 aspartate carbamoyltransferase catalytic subunit [Candidatus Eisenbacteria bacterium]